MLRYFILLLCVSAAFGAATDSGDSAEVSAEAPSTGDDDPLSSGTAGANDDDPLSSGTAGANDDDADTNDGSGNDTLSTSNKVSSTTVYDCYTGKPATKEQLAKYKSKKLLGTCTISIKKCNKKERRRLDGSCNSLKHPVKGSFLSPVRKMLPSQYSNGRDSRKAADGSELTLPRVVRNALLTSGKESSLNWTQAVPAFAIWMFADGGDIHDIRNYLANKTDCCTTGRKDYECTPNIIPEDDPVHRFSGLRCMNLTRPRVWNDIGCTDNPDPIPLEYATCMFDCSQIYNPINDGDKSVRSYEGGHLSTDVDSKGIIWPPNGNGFCPANGPDEKRCFGHTSTELLSSMLVSLWALRHHNYIADQLAKVNPCWGDELLFQTARDINTGYMLQIYFYELWASLIGEKYMIKEGALGTDDGFRDVYDESQYPVMYLEYLYSLRWFHVIQDITARMYSEDGSFLREYPYVNMSFRPGFLDVDNNIVEFTPHMWRQPCGKTDYGVDPDLLDRSNARMQYSIDAMTSDLHKSRLLGFSPYIDYVKLCQGVEISTFEDLEPFISKERIIQLKRVYKVPSDIDLMAGMWVEKTIEGGDVPPTLACIVTRFLAKAVRFDRHWYERSGRPYAFTKGQLAQVRKASMAGLMCNVGDKVTEVQPQAFRIISEDNPLTPCEDLDQLDFSLWADPNCSVKTKA